MCNQEDKGHCAKHNSSLFVKALSGSLAAWLHQFLVQIWTMKPQIPQEWKDAKLTLLPKRQVKQPTDLRPIALTDPVGKAILCGYTLRAKAAMLPTLVTLPLLAYLPHRSVAEALVTIFTFCPDIRTTCAMQASSPWKPRTTNRPILQGGMILSLDLKQAFDRLPRDELQSGLKYCQCPDAIATVLLQWLVNARYEIHHRGGRKWIPTTRGVRQGCKASPIEWTAFLVKLLIRLGQNVVTGTTLTPEDWLRRHLIAYADDLLFCWEINCIQDLIDILQHVATIMDTLETHGLKISMDKTVILLRVVGTAARSQLKKLLVHRNGSRWIAIYRQNSTSWLRVVDSHVYLGVCVSFGALEKQTLKHRLSIGRAAYRRLQRWFVGRHQLTSAQLARIWATSIRTSYSHGLAFVGLTQEGLTNICNRMKADVRSLARSPKHATHEETNHVCHRVHLTPPEQFLKQQWTHYYDQFLSLCTSLDPSDYLHTVPAITNRARVMKIFDRSNTTQHMPSTQVEPFPCPYCEHVSQTRTHLHQHLSKRRKRRKAKPTFERFVLLRDSEGGMPQCRHCGCRLATWRGLNHHIEHNNCPMFSAERPCQAAHVDLPDLRAYAVTQSWQALLENDELMNIVRTSCLLCNKAYHMGKDLLAHLQRMHYDVWNESKFHSSRVISFLRGTKPCGACGRDVSMEHNCHAIRQMAILQMMTTKNKFSHDVLTGAPRTIDTRPLDPDGDVPDQVKRRRTAQTTAPKHDFQPGRDSLDGTPVCAHCTKSLATHFSLRVHIESDCKSFNEHRQWGDHVPLKWLKLKTLSIAHRIDDILMDTQYLSTLKACCVLCGRSSRKPGGIQQHLQQDHQHLLLQAKLTEDTYVNEAAASGRLCKCGNMSSKRGHRCVIYTQLAVLHHARCLHEEIPAHVAVKPPLPPQDPGADTAVLAPAAYWASPDWRAWLSNHCSICAEKTPLAAMPLMEVDENEMNAQMGKAFGTYEKWSQCRQHSP